MNNSIDKYENIGFLKNMVICLYDLMLLFSVLFFMSLPWIIVTSGDAVTNNIFYEFKKIGKSLIDFKILSA